MIELHSEGGDLTAGKIAERVNEIDSEAALNAQKVGWLVRKLGFKKERTSNSRSIHWDEDRVAKMASQYGLLQQPVLSRRELSSSSPLSQLRLKRDDDVGDNVSTGKESSSTLSQANPTPEDDDDDNNDDVVVDKRGLSTMSQGTENNDSPTVSSLGMTIKQAIAIWEKKGRPVIYLGPGENCLDLKRLLRHPDVNQRHLAAIGAWLVKNRPPSISGSDSSHGGGKPADWDALEKELDAFLGEAGDDSD